MARKDSILREDLIFFLKDRIYEVKQISGRHIKVLITVSNPGKGGNDPFSSTEVTMSPRKLMRLHRKYQAEQARIREKERTEKMLRSARVIAGSSWFASRIIPLSSSSMSWA